MTNTLLWDLPGDVLAAPASAMCGWKGVNPPLSLSLLPHTSTLCLEGVCLEQMQPYSTLFYCSLFDRSKILRGLLVPCSGAFPTWPLGVLQDALA